MCKQLWCRITIAICHGILMGGGRIFSETLGLGPFKLKNTGFILLRSRSSYFRFWYKGLHFCPGWWFQDFKFLSLGYLDQTFKALPIPPLCQFLSIFLWNLVLLHFLYSMSKIFTDKNHAFYWIVDKFPCCKTVAVVCNVPHECKTDKPNYWQIRTIVS